LSKPGAAEVGPTLAGDVLPWVGVRPAPCEQTEHVYLVLAERIGTGLEIGWTLRKKE